MQAANAGGASLAASAARDAAVVRYRRIARFIASAMLALYLIVTLMFPVALVNKVIFVLLLGMMAVALASSSGRVRIRTLSPIVVLMIFLYGFAYACITQTDPILTNQLMLTVALLMLIYLIDWYALDFDFLVKLAGLVMCLFTGFAIYAVVVVPNSGLGRLFFDYFFDYSLGASTQRSFSDSALFSFRVGPVPFLILPYFLFLSSFLERRRARDLIAVFLIFAVIIISTSRALFFSCVLLASYLLITRMRPSRQVIASCIGAALAVFVIARLVAETTIFSLQDQGNSGKVAHMVSFVEHMSPSRLLFGEGLASTYFTAGYNAVVAQTEVTPLDMIRYFGLPLTALLYAALLFPTLRRESYAGANRQAQVFFGIYLLIAATNPNLFNSYGLMVVVWYWSRILGLGRGLPGGSPVPGTA
jgi:hypothetical protein